VKAICADLWLNIKLAILELTFTFSGVGTIEVGRMDRINKRAAFISDRMAFVEWSYIPYGNAA
jgi:hypothetical protein